MRKNRSWDVALVTASMLIAGGAALAEDIETHAGGKNLTELKFAPVPGLPTCASAAVESGDPATGAAILAVRAKSGCVVPWHWHTAAENLMIFQGEVRIEMKDMGKPVMLRTGGFASMPGRHVHEFRCVKNCAFFLYTDEKFDIHYVDPEGKEIAPEQALKPHKQTVATAQ